MSVKTLRTSVAAAMGGAVLLAGLVVGASIALADDPEPLEEPVVTTESEPVEERGRQLEQRFHMFRGQLGEIVDELGIDLDQIRQQIADGATLDEIIAGAGIDLDEFLNDARDKLLDSIDERVTAGDMTEDQADAIKERLESFDLGEFNFDLGRRFGDIPRLGGFFGDLVPDVDLSELRDRIESGMTLDEALAEFGVDVEGMLEEARDSALSHIDEMVTDGTIAQERADQLKERIEGFDLGEGFPFGPRGFHFEFDCDRFEDFDLDSFRGQHRHGRGFFSDGADDIDAESALFSV